MFEEKDLAIGEPIVKREPQVASELKYLENRIHALSENIKNLFSRLKPVLKEELKDVSDEKEPENLCDLAAAIRTQRREIERMEDFVKNIQSDLQI